MTSTCTIVDNVKIEIRPEDALELEDDSILSEIINNDALNKDLYHPRSINDDEYSDMTTFNEIKVALKKGNDFTDSVKDQYKDPIWGEMTVRAEYNVKRECIKIDLINIHPNRLYYKNLRKHFFVLRIYCKEKLPDWNSGLFDLCKGNPKFPSWTFDNLLLENLKKCYLEIKLYRIKKNIKWRLLANGRIDFVNIYPSSPKPKKIILKTIYFDKPQKIKLPSDKEKKSKKGKPIPKQKEEKKEDDIDVVDNVEVKFCNFHIINPEIFIGFGYNIKTNILTIDIRKCTHLLVKKGNNILLSETYVEVILNPEKVSSVTNPFYRTESPEYREKFHFTVFQPFLKVGNVTFHVINHLTKKKQFTLIVDRETDDHWAEMMMSAPNIIYMWHDLSRYKKDNK